MKILKTIRNTLAFIILITTIVFVNTPTGSFICEQLINEILTLF